VETLQKSKKGQARKKNVPRKKKCSVGRRGIYSRMQIIRKAGEGKVVGEKKKNLDGLRGRTQKGLLRKEESPEERGSRPFEHQGEGKRSLETGEL